MNKKHYFLCACLLAGIALPLTTKSAGTEPEEFSAAWFRERHEQRKASGIKSAEANAKDCDEARIIKELKDINDLNPDTRRFAAANLEVFCEQLGTRKQEVVSALKKQLNDEHNLARQAAAIALAKFDFGNNKDMIKPVLFEALKNDTVYSGDAITILKRFGPDAGDLAPEVLKLIERENSIFIFYKSMSYATYVWLLRDIGTPETLKVVNSIERMEKFKYSLKLPPMQIGIIVFFTLLFLFSLVLRKKYKGLVCRPLLIPVIVYIWRFIEEGFFRTLGDTIELDQIDEWTLFWLNSNVNYLLFLAVIAAGLLPWALSWLLLWRRSRRALFELSISSLIIKLAELQRTGKGKKEIEDILLSLSERFGRLSKREFHLIEAVRAGLDEPSDIPNVLREMTKIIPSKNSPPDSASSSKVIVIKNNSEFVKEFRQILINDKIEVIDANDADDALIKAAATGNEIRILHTEEAKKPLQPH